ncbi:MAG: AAA family ATPase [Candidatus Gastranaerophilales bacterium]|nr:AAA family ATPase [Candidatus Gastranaerophilales bacterium]
MFGEAFIQFYEEDKKYFETGFKDLDAFLTGVTKGSVITIGARPAMGKSSFAISICNHLLETGKKVLFCELGTSKLIIERRFISAKTKIPQPLEAVKSKTEEWEKITNAIQFYNDKNFEVFCKMNLTVDELEEKIRAEKPDVVFIDSIQCLQMPKAPNLTEAINLAIKEIKRIAIEYNTIVVLTSQLSRAPEARCDKRPILSDLRNGSLLEDLSDVIMMIYRSKYYNDDDKDTKNQAEILLRKNKFGDLFTVCLKTEKGIFADFSTEDYIRTVFS